MTTSWPAGSSLPLAGELIMTRGLLTKTVQAVMPKTKNNNPKNSFNKITHWRFTVSSL
jgi:hypothetical protein